MSTVFQQNNETLQQLWKINNPNNDQYLAKQYVITWVNQSLQKLNALSNVGQSLTDIQGLIKQYLIQIHAVDEQGLQNVSLNYIEAVDFLKWLTNSYNQEKKEEQPELKQQILSNQMKNIQNLNNQQQNNNDEENYPINMIASSERIINQIKKESNRIKQSRQKSPQSDKVLSSQNNIDNMTSSPNQFNLDFISRKYKQYLKIIFQHYCKISYATGQDPTFQQIMHKTTVLTINKFMMFCKDFQINKINQNVNRQTLIELFKKNSLCYKQMSLEQFQQVLSKFGQLCQNINVQENNQNKQSQGQSINPNILKILKYLQIQTSKKFRQKMKRLNIQYRSGPKTNAQLKVVPDGYKFKYSANNGRSEQQVKQQIQQRKIHRSQKKIYLKQKANLLNENSFQKKKINISVDKKINPKQTNIQSANIINKILSPPIPPPRKISQLQQPPKIAPIKNYQQSPQVSNSSNSTNNLFKKQIGYAQIHKIKNNQGYGKRNHLKLNSRQQKNSFKLNSIVQDARMQVKQQPRRERQNYPDNSTQSIGTNSRQESMRLKSYDINKINNKMQLINDKLVRQKKIQKQLDGILDMSDDDDQFLRQHLQRQKKNDIIGKRLSNRLNAFQQQI